MSINVPHQFPSPADVRGRRIVVTGGAKGLGKVLSMAYARAGAKVLIVGRNASDLEVWAKSLAEVPGAEVTLCSADVSVPEDNARVVATAEAAWGGLDVWVANAGVSSHYGPAVDMDAAAWRAILATNLDGVLYGFQAAVGAMRRSGGGSLIATSSVLATRPRRGLGAYSASKAGVEALVKSLALELGPEGITVNAVAPGWFDSPLAEGWMANPAMAQKILDHSALGRWGAPEDLPGAYLFLGSAASRFVTGSVLTVDGGYQCV